MARRIDKTYLGVNFFGPMNQNSGYGNAVRAFSKLTRRPSRSSLVYSTPTAMASSARTSTRPTSAASAPGAQTGTRTKPGMRAGRRSARRWGALQMGSIWRALTFCTKGTARGMGLRTCSARGWSRSRCFGPVSFPPRTNRPGLSHRRSLCSPRLTLYSMRNPMRRRPPISRNYWISRRSWPSTNARRNSPRWRPRTPPSSGCCTSSCGPRRLL